MWIMKSCETPDSLENWKKAENTKGLRNHMLACAGCMDLDKE